MNVIQREKNELDLNWSFQIQIRGFTQSPPHTQTNLHLLVTSRVSGVLFAAKARQFVIGIQNFEEIVAEDISRIKRVTPDGNGGSHSDLRQLRNRFGSRGSVQVPSTNSTVLRSN